MVEVHVIKDTGRVDLTELENYSKYPLHRGLGQHIRTKISYVVRPDSINIQNTHTYTGINKHSNKRWFKFVNTINYSFKVRELKNGKKYLYIWSIPSTKSGSIHEVSPSIAMSSFYNVDTSNFWAEVFSFCETNIGTLPPYIEKPVLNGNCFNQVVLRALNHYCKPNLLLFSTDSGTNLIFRDKGISLRTSTFHEVFKKLLGHMYNKKLVKLVAYNRSAEFIHNLSYLPKSVPVDWIIDWLNQEDVNKYQIPAKHLSSLFDKYVPKVHARKFFLSMVSSEYSSRLATRDSLRMLGFLNLTPENYPEFNKLFKLDLDSLHIKLAELCRLKEEKGLLDPLNLPVLQEPLQTLGFTLPSTKKDMYDWSTEFGNCVSSYANRVSNGETLVLRRADEACIEIKDGVLKQYLAKFNQSLEPEKFWEGVDILLEHGMIKEQPNENECWGYQSRPQKEEVSK